MPYEPYVSFEKRYHYKRISDDSRGRFAPIYERAVYHYHHRMEVDMPFTRKAAAKPIRNRDMMRVWRTSAGRT